MCSELNLFLVSHPLGGVSATVGKDWGFVAGVVMETVHGTEWLGEDDSAPMKVDQGRASS